jgi:serine/threonine protein kinase
VDATRWVEISPSGYPWEREALAFIRERLPDHDPYRAWSNFEFIAGDGSINEVDLLVLTPKGFFLVEIKSRPGKVEGDSSTWTWIDEGRRYTDDNPLILANRKAKKLIDQLRRQRAMQKVRSPFLEARVFLSAPDTRVQLPDNIRPWVNTRDKPDAEPNSQRGIVAALTRWPTDEPPRHRIDRPIAKALTRAMEEAGIRQSQRARRVGDYRLDQLLSEGPTYQDWAATHVALERELARIRLYVVEPGASAEARASIVAAAKREYLILNGITHPGILKAKAYTEHERGPALVFEHTPGAQRLDHYLAERGDRLTVDARLDFLRQIAEAVRFAHRKRLYHRALSPQNVLVLDPQADSPRLQVFNWQTGVRAPSSTRATSLGISMTSHLANHIEEDSAVFMAPEALTERGDAGEQADVFSLGALAYLLFSGQPPARSFFELAEKLREGGGLQISSVLDGVAGSLQYLIQFSTHPQVTARLDSVADFLDELDKFEDEITTPEPREGVVLDPTQAKPGELLADGLRVKKRLGKGASSIALLVEREGKELVLKVALEPSDSARLRAEADLLRKLGRHQFIVQVHEVADYGGRVGLLMDKAGDTTLAQRLREEGRLHLELLERFGEDLLQVVDWLEQQGVPHRDIKPDNLGVAPMGRDDQLHLVLFDFSLADTPAENVRAGTVPYLDPFLALRKPPRWDTYAERFAAAMTLYQMATGTLPVWGDGQSDPAVLAVEATLDGEAFEPALREPMQAFFARALRRDYRQRFDNAQDMLAGWRGLFAAAARTEVATDHGERPVPVTPLDEATPETRLSELGLTARALNATERANLHTVGDLLRYPLTRLRRLRGVGSKTRRELVATMEALAERFPTLAAGPKAIRHEDVGPTPETETPTLDALAALLVPAPRTESAQASARTLAVLLGLDDPTPEAWPSQSDVARQLHVNPATVSLAVVSARTRWLKTPPMTQLREDIVALLEAQGGAMTTHEVAEALINSRGSVQVEPLRTRQARALVRAAVETERDRAAPRWIARRAHGGGAVLLCRDELGDDGSPAIDGERLADYAEALGRVADDLAREEPLRPPNRVLEALQAVEAPTGRLRPGASRLLQLAAATSRHAALSSRLELYPRGMPAARTLKLALGALAGARELSPEQVRDRVAGRYPEAEPLPDRPALDALLEQVGSELRWHAGARGGAGTYVSPLREFTTVSTATTVTRPTSIAPTFHEVPADRVEAEEFARRLDYSIAQQHFLALVVSPRHAVQAERLLAARFPIEVRSLDSLLIRHMRAFAQEKRIDWPIVLRADAIPSADRPGSKDWSNLQRVVKAVLPRVKDALAQATRHVLLTNPGLLARYGQMDLLGELQQETGRPGGPPGLWVLVPADGQQQRPMLDGQPVPVFTTAQWARVPDIWLLARGPDALAS